MAAVMSADMDNTDKIVTLVDECGNMDIDFFHQMLMQGIISLP